MPPSASRTPHLWARSARSAPPEDPQWPESLGPPPPPPKDGKLTKLRRRSGSTGSVSSVSLTSRIRSSLELPRTRSISRDSFSSFVGGIKLRREKEAEDEWRARDVAARNPPSYNMPARYLYRQPSGSGLVRTRSRSSSCSLASSGSLAAHFAPKLPAMTFPSQRRRETPADSRTSEVKSRSDSASGERSGGEVCEGASRAGSQGASVSRDALGDGVDGERAVPCQEVGSGGRLPRASSAPNTRRTALGEHPLNESNPTIPRGVNGKEYPPSASASASTLAYLASASGEQAEPQRRRRSSVMGRLRGRRTGDGEDSQASDTPTPTPTSRDGSRPPSSSRSFKDAAKAAFHRSMSRGSSSRRSPASEASPIGSPTKGVTSPLPDTPGPLTSNPPSVSASLGGPGHEYPNDWPLTDSPSPEILPRPRPIVDPHAVRPCDRSSISSYETSRSHQRASTLTQNTSRSQSEMGIVNTVGAGDGQKVLGGNEKPRLASSAALGAGSAAQGTGTPPVRKKSSRRRLRDSAGSETSSSINAPATPTLSHAATAPTPAAANGSMAMPESEARTQKVQSLLQPDTDAAKGLAPLQSRNHVSPVDPTMLPRPLNLSHSQHASHSTDSIAPHKLRRQTKSQHQLNGEITADSPQGTEVSLASPADTPAEKKTPPVSRSEVASNGGVSSPQLRSPRDEERKHRGRGREEGAKQLEKILVRCCGCGYFHDLPHRIYERMIIGFEGSLEAKEDASRGEDKHEKCPWCRHGMDVRCCAGYVAVVQLKERLH